MNTKCVFWFSLQLLSETFFVLNRIHQYCHKRRHAFMQNTHCPYQILMKLEVSRYIFQNPQISIFMNIRPVGVELYCTMWTDGRTDWTKLIVAFRNSANAPENLSFFLVALQGLHN